MRVRALSIYFGPFLFGALSACGGNERPVTPRTILEAGSRGATSPIRSSSGDSSERARGVPRIAVLVLALGTGGALPRGPAALVHPRRLRPVPAHEGVGRHARGVTAQGACAICVAAVTPSASS